MEAVKGFPGFAGLAEACYQLGPSDMSGSRSLWGQGPSGLVEMPVAEHGLRSMALVLQKHSVSHKKVVLVLAHLASANALPALAQGADRMGGADCPTLGASPGGRGGQ